MSERNKMLDNHLFANRKRVLAVPAATVTPTRRMQHVLLLNVTLALVMFGLFILGLWLSNPATGGKLGQIPGKTWGDFLQQRMGNVIGEGMAEKTPWIVSRATGILAYLMMFVTVVLGLLSSMRLTGKFIHPAGVMHVHKMLSLLLLFFTVFHLAGLLLDNYIKMPMLEILVPFKATYKPVPTGLGSLSMYGAMAVIVSVYLSGKIGYRAWRIIHYLSFGVFAASLVHGFMDGSDSKNIWMQAIYFSTGFIVVMLLGARLIPRRDFTLKSKAQG